MVHVKCYIHWPVEPAHVLGLEPWGLVAQVQGCYTGYVHVYSV